MVTPPDPHRTRLIREKTTFHDPSQSNALPKSVILLLSRNKEMTTGAVLKDRYYVRSALMLD